MKRNIYKLILILVLITLFAGCSKSESKKSSDNERLYQAIYNGDKNMFEALLSAGVDINALRNENINGHVSAAGDFENVYPLEIACQRSPEMAYELLEMGADVNAVDPYINSTALIYALSSNNPGRFKLAMDLIEKGADTEHIDDNKRIAINLAVHTLSTDPDEAYEESYELLKMLSEKTDMNYVIESSASNPLREAAKYGNCNAIDYILDNELVDIDLVTDGMTPLMIAVIGKNESACELLIKRGADVTIISREGKTAYDYAKEYDLTDIMELFNED